MSISLLLIIVDGVIISHFPYGPTAYFSIHNVTLRHDIKDVSKNTISEAYPQLIFSNFTSKLGKRVKGILQHLFPVPKEDSTRTISLINQHDFISFRHHTFSKTPTGNVELLEMGPRFEMKLYNIKLGTIDMADAESEWSLKSFMNTTRKRDFI
jgi:U3 small nucleolar ribonucleoprotein protein IMP4